MATIERRIKYRCSDDCVQGGCPWHEGRLIYQSTSDAYQFDMNGRTLYFERGELDAMIELLRSLGRVDAVQVPANVELTGAETDSEAGRRSVPVERLVGRGKD